MLDPQIISLLGQLGASGIFAIALVVVVRAFYNHLMDDQKLMRERISILEKRLDLLDTEVKNAR